MSFTSQLVKVGENVFELRSVAAQARNEISSELSRPKKYALARLHRDFHECVTNPLPTVAAAPLNEQVICVPLLFPPHLPPLLLCSFFGLSCACIKNHQNHQPSIFPPLFHRKPERSVQSTFTCLAVLQIGWAFFWRDGGITVLCERWIEFTGYRSFWLGGYLA